MERRIQSRWSDARRFARNWIRDLVDRSGCRRVAYRHPETADRAKRIDDHCQNQVCETISIGRNGTPGPVGDSEKLYRILVAPHQVDLSTEAILITAISHTETMGMSVLRHLASITEFSQIARELVAGDPKRHIFGVTEIDCKAIRDLKNHGNEPRRQKGDRHFIVLDTDLPNLPNHADVFNTFPRQQINPKDPTNKAIWRKERARLFDLVKAQITKSAVFRDGLLDHVP